MDCFAKDTKCIAKKELVNQDFKIQAIRKYPNIPKGSEVLFDCTICNLYGVYAAVWYNDHRYYVDIDDLEVIEK